MKAIVNTGPGRLEMRELPDPQPRPGQVRIRTKACGICATDLQMINGWERTGFPAVPGHEWSGFVEAVGDEGDSSLINKRCVGENVLSDGGEVGFEHPGGYGELFLTEIEKLHILPDDYPLAAATLIEPLAVAVRGMRRLREDCASPALVFGDGPIGLLMTLLLSRSDRQVVLVGGRPKRMELGKRFGGTKVLNYHCLGKNGIEAIEKQEGRFSTIVEAAGSANALETAIKLADREARILVIGDYGKKHASFAWNELLHREIELIGSNASAGAWPEAVRLAVEEKLPLEDMVSHRIPAHQFEEGLRLVRYRPNEVVKVVLEWV